MKRIKEISQSQMLSTKEHHFKTTTLSSIENWILRDPITTLMQVTRTQSSQPGEAVSTQCLLRGLEWRTILTIHLRRFREANIWASKIMEAQDKDSTHPLWLDREKDRATPETKITGKTPSINLICLANTINMINKSLNIIITWAMKKWRSPKLLKTERDEPM